MRTRDLVAGGAFLALGLGAAYLTSGLPKRSLPNTPGPEFFPWVVIAIILGLAIVLVARGLAGASVETTDQEAAPSGAHRRATFGAIASFIVYLALLPSLGFIVATIPFFAAMMVFYGERRPLMVVAAPIIATVGFYVLFRHGFQIILPQGVLTGLIS